MTRVDATGPRVPIRTSSEPDVEHGEGPDGGHRGEGKAEGAQGPVRGRPATAADRTAPVPQTGESAEATRNPEETKAPERAPKDGYQSKGKEEGGLLKDGLRRPPRGMGQLLPETGRFQGQDMKQLAQRFASDLALMRPEVMPGDLSGKEQAGRLWQFFSAYAKAAAGSGNQEGLEAFREALERAGFLRFKDQETGKSGLNRAMWGLEAKTQEAARARLERVELVPMQEDAHLPEGAFRVLKEAKAEQQQQARQPGAQPAIARDAPGAEAMLIPVPNQEAARVNLLAAHAAAQSVMQPREEQVDRDRGQHRPRRDGVLGGNSLFNVLHTLRGKGEDSVEAKDRFNRLAVGAIMLLAGVSIAIVALVML